MSQTGSVKLLDAVIATERGSNHPPRGVKRTFQAEGTTSAGAGAATIIIQASNATAPAAATDVDWVTLGTITLTLATTKSNDGFTTDAAWRWVRARLSAISGTDATVTVWMGC